MGYDKWVSEKGWFGLLGGQGSSSGPPVSCRVCAACVQRRQPVKHISFKSLPTTTVISFTVSHAEPGVTPIVGGGFCSIGRS